MGKWPRDEWEGIGLRWSRDDERAEKLMREKIKKYPKKGKEREENEKGDGWAGAPSSRAEEALVVRTAGPVKSLEQLRRIA